jgi:type IV fimbrial biogenesis protein FimT
VYPVTQGHSSVEAGFSLVEALIAVVIASILLAIAVPSMSDWLMANKAAAATEFYAEGFKLARSQAVMHNSASRIVLKGNGNGQMDWQVDICFPTAKVPCSDISGVWSTTTSIATGDPEGANGFKSVARVANALPNDRVLQLTFSPSGATDVYYTSLGWVDTRIDPHLSQLTLAPVTSRSGAFPHAAIVVTLAGTASICNPTVDAPDSRACPP